MAVAAPGGGGNSSMYAVQIESLEQFQTKLTGILQDLETGVDAAFHPRWSIS